jgi:pyridoxine 5'-phosphate synthase PdxJ
LNIGHAIIAEAVFKGLQAAIQDIRALMFAAREKALKAQK